MIAGRGRECEDAERVALSSGIQFRQLLLAERLQPPKALFSYIKAARAVEVQLSNVPLVFAVNTRKVARASGWVYAAVLMSALSLITQARQFGPMYGNACAASSRPPKA